MATREFSDRRTIGRALVAVLLLWTLPHEAPAQAPGSPARLAAEVSFVPRWSPGESRSYEQIKGHRELRKGQLPEEVSSRSRLDLKVVEAGKEGYLLSWTISASSFDGPQRPEQKAEREKLLKAMDGWTVLLDIDPVGELRGVRNWKELGARMGTLRDTLGQGREPSKTEGRPQIEEVTTREARAFLAPIGLRFKTGNPIRYNVQIPGAAGGQPLPARASFRLAQVDLETGRAIVDWTQVIQPPAQSKGLAGSLDRLKQNLGQPPRPGESDVPKSISVVDECRYLMDARSGWVLDMKHRRTIQTADGRSSEMTLRIRRLDQAPAARPTEAKGRAPSR